jgi:hypothetical protein
MTGFVMDDPTSSTVIDDKQGHRCEPYSISSATHSERQAGGSNGSDQ